MKTLLSFTSHWKNHKTTVLLGLFLSITVAISSVALLGLSGWFIAASAFAGLLPATASLFNYFLPAAMIRFLALLRIGSRYADRVINHDLTFQILANLRVWFYEKLIPLSPAKLLQRHSGDLFNRMINDIDALDHLYLNVLSPFFIALCLILLSTIFIAYFSGFLALISLIGMLTSTIIITLLAIKKGLKIGHDVQSHTAQLRITIINALQGFIDLLLFLKKSERDVLLDEKNNALTIAQQKAAALKGTIIALMTFFSGLTLFLIIYCGIPLVQTHQLNGAILTMITLLVIAVFEQLLTLPLAALSLGKTKAAANRIVAITSEKPFVEFLSDEKINHYDLSLNNISFHYPDHPKNRVENVTLDIPMNTPIALSGVSGAGKSTLLNLIARVYDPSEGSIFLGGAPLKNLSETVLRNTVSLVTQQVHIFNGSVRDNLCLFQNNFTDEQCFDVLEKMNLTDTVFHLPEKLDAPMGEFGNQFSGGQIRRIAIARALLHDTPILLLDEPSTGLDNPTFDSIWKKCESLFAKKTLIIATHDRKILEKMQKIVKIS
ncbi:MAG: thiol reductant ABC exporter subunit CydC [Coxiellaceae bacterium]|nr:thiol reductant ABC exporter subunit CydC [Coxiellaceae bacterium]